MQSIQGGETLAVVPVDGHHDNMQLSQAQQNQLSPAVTTSADLSAQLQVLTSSADTGQMGDLGVVPQEMPQGMGDSQDPSALAEEVEAILNQGKAVCLTFNPFIPSSKRTFSHHLLLKECISEVVRVGSINHRSSELAMESHVLHTVWCNISGEAAQGSNESACLTRDHHPGLEIDSKSPACDQGTNVRPQVTELLVKTVDSVEATVEPCSLAFRKRGSPVDD